MSENRSTSPPKGRVGSQSVFGTKASLVANTVRARIGGRFAALHIPQSEAEKLERVAKDATEQRKLRALPEAGLSLEYAYGFNGRRCQNLYDLGQLSYCYSVAALGVVWDDEKKEQRIFQGHTAEITAMACCSRSRRIATGQKMAPGETTASILLWSAEELPVPSMRQQILGHNQAIYSIAFSADGRWLLSVAAEERGQKPSKNELKANASPLCAWRIDDMPAKGPARQIRAPQTRLPIREKVRLVSHPVDSNSEQFSFAFMARVGYSSFRCLSVAAAKLPRHPRHGLRWPKCLLHHLQLGCQRCCSGRQDSHADTSTAARYCWWPLLRLQDRCRSTRTAWSHIIYS